MTRFLAGNDVVDRGLREESRKGLHDRFVERVFTPEERELVWESGPLDRPGRIWLLWAAKESAFKVVSKLRRRREGGPPPTFEHAAFRVELAEAGVEPAGWVAWRDVRVAFRGMVSPELVHVVGWAPMDPAEPDPDPASPPPGLTTGLSELDGVEGDDGTEGGEGWREFLRPRFSDAEWRSVHGLSSARVRLGARAAAALRLGVDEEELALVCPEGPAGRTPPRLLLRDGAAPLDVTLSHHGRYLAWALVD